jgi:DNA-binding CsgD family transcriptional regulator/tetratricopeptide (TPR) repeat protein
VAQSLLLAPALREVVNGTPAERAVQRALDAIAGREEAGMEGLSADAKQLRAFDLAAVAIGQVADQAPLALLIDDVQWSDDDTLRLLRYVTRTDADRPIFLFLAIRPDEFSQVGEAVNLVADMERMGMVRRLRLARFSPPETAELARQQLGGKVDPASAEAMHAQSEGVPFIVEELIRSYRDAGLLQQIDGTWRLSRNAAKLVPSAVRTLIQRRAGRLPADTRAVLADAAVLGRSFSLRDLQAVRARIDTGADGRADGAGGTTAAADLADVLQPACEAGLLFQHEQGSPADFTFTHEQVREYAIDELPQARRRAIHRALVDLMLESGDPSPAGLPLIAYHALAAGDSERAGRLSVEAAQGALRSNAAEEALHLVEKALPTVSSPDLRRQLLIARDDAYATLRRASDRLEGLAELAALVEALRDPDAELDVQLRRVAALRLARDNESAAELARRIRTRASDAGRKPVELRANLELGQAILNTPLGEGFSAVGNDAELKAAEEAFRAAAALAEELGDDRALASALRELGTILLGQLRIWFGKMRESPLAMEFAARATAGEAVDALLNETEVAPLMAEARTSFERALSIFERIGDRTGVMSTVIAMAYINYAPVIHLVNSARHLEEIRHVVSRMSAMVTESERDKLELQLLYGVHVYARAKVVPDLMLVRGEEAYRLARMIGDRSVEFLAAGGVALSHAEMGEVPQADEWLEKAAAAVSSAPTPTRMRQLEAWRGTVRAAAGDADGMRRHFELALARAAEQGRPADRCELYARQAVEAARLGAATGDEDLLALAESSAAQVKELYSLLPGRSPWNAQADAAICQVRLARGDPGGAAAAAGQAVQYLQSSEHEDMFLDILVPAGRALLAAGPPEVQAMVRGFLQIQLGRIVQSTVNEQLRVRWLRGPWGRDLVELAGPMDQLQVAAKPTTPDGTAPAARLDDDDRALLRLLTQGSTNQEIGAELGIDEGTVTQRLARLLTQIGASTRAEATTMAFRGLAL